MNTIDHYQSSVAVSRNPGVNAFLKQPGLTDQPIYAVLQGHHNSLMQTCKAWETIMTRTRLPKEGPTMGTI
jgi:hypothetical protein